jgi:predicted DNA-binding protein
VYHLQQDKSFGGEQMMELISIRLPREMVERLRVLARLEAVRRNAAVTWSGLVREAIEAWLAAESQPQNVVESTR